MYCQSQYRDQGRYMYSRPRCRQRPHACSLGNKFVKNCETKSKRNSTARKTDWVKLRKIIDKNLILKDAVTPAEIDATVNNIANIIKTALDKSCPKSKVKDMDFFISEETSKLIKLKLKIKANF